MKRIGIIGGVSPESTVIYYRLLNAAARAVYGGETSADIVIHSLNFNRMHALYRAGDWRAFKDAVVAAGRGLAAAGAERLAIASNTTNMAADDLAAAVDVPVIRLLDALVEALRAGGVRRPLLLGTPVVMTGDFYRTRLREAYGVDALVPGREDQEEVRRVIFEELVEGVVREASRESWRAIIARGRNAGADSVIYGCTEIAMLMRPGDVDMPAFDTTAIHAGAIARAAFGPGDAIGAQ